MKFSTKAIHTGQKPDKETGAVIPPVYMTSTYKQEAPAVHKGYDYTRAGNPNFSNLEETLASLENGKYATIFSSGLGAVNGIIATLKSGDTILGTNDMYGGTYRIFNKVYNNFGIKFFSVDTQNLNEVENAVKKHKPKLLFLETPTNPLLKISDIKAIAEISRKNNVRLLVDNTFATPFFQNPLDLGADCVLHSTTKYIGGHSDVIGGVIITNDKETKEKLDFARMAAGLNPSPFDAWLTSRGVKTLALRMKKHEENARKLVKFLSSRSDVEKIHYPGLETHKYHDIAKKQMTGFGGIVSVSFKFDIETTKKLISQLKVFTLAESLGGIESLVDHPASMTHASIPKEEREKSGLTDGLIRFSVGIEDPEDLIKDIENALKQIQPS